MADFKVGQHIEVLGPSMAGPNYEPGVVYQVSSIDTSDSTLKAKDASGWERGWVRWSDCKPAGSSVWSLIAADLPEDVLLFLACFDGIGRIQLKEQVMDAILAKVPDLPARLVAYAHTAAGAARIARNIPQKPGHSADGAVS